MIRRILLGGVLIGASLSRLNCEIFFPLSGPPAVREPFLGCFKGAITEPAPLGEITIVLEPPAPGIEDGAILSGCITATEPRFSATMTGLVLEDRTEARFSVMPDGMRPSFVLLVTRQPAEGNATGLTLVNETNMPFKSAQDVPRCATTLTCADLGIQQPFLPGGGL